MISRTLMIGLPSRRDIKNKDVWVEGSSASAALKDTGLSLIYRDVADKDVCADPVKVTVIDSSLTLYKRDGTTAVAMDKEADPWSICAV